MVSWGSKKQSIVSRSFTEAEYQALASTSCVVIWLLQILHDLRISHHSSASQYYDSKAALSLAANLVYHACTKHVDIDCHFFREQQSNGVINTFYVASGHQLLDIFTKTLGEAQF